MVFFEQYSLEQPLRLHVGFKRSMTPELLLQVYNGSRYYVPMLCFFQYIQMYFDFSKCDFTVLKNFSVRLCYTIHDATRRLSYCVLAPLETHNLQMKLVLVYRLCMDERRSAHIVYTARGLPSLSPLRGRLIGNSFGWG